MKRVILLALLMANMSYAQNTDPTLHTGTGKAWNLSHKLIENGKSDLKRARKLKDREKEAKALNNMGLGFDYLCSYDEALDYYLKALRIYEEVDQQKGIAKLFNHIGMIYKRLKNHDKALEYYQRALNIYQRIGDEKGIANALTYIGNIHYHFLNYDKALDYFYKSLRLYERIGDKKGITFPLNNTGTIYRKTGELEKALEYFSKSFEMSKQSDDDWGIANTSNNMGELHTALGNYEEALSYLGNAEKLSKKIKARDVLQDSYEYMAGLYRKKGDTLKYLEYYKLYADTKDMIFSERTNNNIARLQTKFEVEKKEMENKILRLKVDKQSIIIYASIFVLLIVLSFTYFIMKEKKKSEKLLLNILPVRVAQDLKKTGKTDPVAFTDVTVCFADLVGFTKISSNVEPKELIDELNDIFTAFDSIIEKNRCERIKTIGDAYLAVCGMPQENENHAENILKSAIEIVQHLEERNQKSKIKWNVRIGIHTGKVVGGVVGVKKYIYDVFGDTINTANRMESSSEPMKINVSEATHGILKNRFHFTPREEVEVKGKGRMKMYFADP